MVTSCDILVIGGGVAGLPAAVTAARAGLNVILAEREPFLGGSGVTALHRYLCGLFRNGPEQPSEPLNPGLPSEILDRLKALAPGSHPLQMDRVWGFPFEPAHLREIYSTLAHNEPCLTQMTSVSMESIECPHHHIRSVTLQTPEGPLSIAPQAVIDATGDGAVIGLSGAPSQPAPEPEHQMSAVTVHFDGIQGERKLLALKIPWQLGHLSAGQPEILPFAGFAPGCGEHDGFCKFSLPQGIDSEDEVRARLGHIRTLLAAQLPELRDIRVIGISSILKRDGIRLDGEWELDEKTILKAHKFSDGVVRNAWPMENWSPGAHAPTYQYPPENDYYEIPRRCLRSRTVSNLFAAGRCISASSKARSSIRPMGTCMALGEAVANEAIRWSRAKW